MNKMNRFLWGVLYIVFLSACNNKPPQTIGELFPETLLVLSLTIAE